MSTSIKQSFAWLARAGWSMLVLSLATVVVEIAVVVAAILASVLSVLVLALVGGAIALLTLLLETLLSFSQTLSDLAGILGGLIVLLLFAAAPLVLAVLCIGLLLPEDEDAGPLPFDADPFFAPSMWFLPVGLLVAVSPESVAPPWEGWGLLFAGGLAGAVLLRSALYASVHHVRKRPQPPDGPVESYLYRVNPVGRALSARLDLRWYYVPLAFGLYVLFSALHLLIIGSIPGDTDFLAETLAGLPLIPTTVRELLLIPVGAAGVLVAPWAVSAAVGNCVLVFDRVGGLVIRGGRLAVAGGVRLFGATRFVVRRYVLLRP